MAESIVFFFCILIINFYFVMYYIFLRTNTHTQLHTDKNERKKHTPVPSSLFI